MRHSPVTEDCDPSLSSKAREPIATATGPVSSSSRAANLPWRRYPGNAFGFSSADGSMEHHQVRRLSPDKTSPFRAGAAFPESLTWTTISTPVTVPGFFEAS